MAPLHLPAASGLKIITDPHYTCRLHIEYINSTSTWLLQTTLRLDHYWPDMTGVQSLRQCPEGQSNETQTVCILKDCSSMNCGLLLVLGESNIGVDNSVVFVVVRID